MGTFLRYVEKGQHRIGRVGGLESLKDDLAVGEIPSGGTGCHCGESALRMTATSPPRCVSRRIHRLTGKACQFAGQFLDIGRHLFHSRARRVLDFLKASGMRRDRRLAAPDSNLVRNVANLQHTADKPDFSACATPRSATRQKVDLPPATMIST